MTNMKKRHWVGVLSVSLLLGLAAWINRPLITRELRVAALPAAPSFESGQRILLLCGGMIQQAPSAAPGRSSIRPMITCSAGRLSHGVHSGVN